VKLGDFGIVKVAAWRDRTEPGGLRGKYGYLAPESVTEGVVDHRADLFSVGVVLAEMLMIRRLFMADNPLDVLLKVRDGNLERLDRYGRHIHKDLRKILEAALERDPQLRYQDAATFRDTLHRYLFDHGLMVRSKEVRQFLKRLDEVEQAPPDKPPSVEAPRHMLDAASPSPLLAPPETTAETVAIRARAGVVPQPEDPSRSPLAEAVTHAAQSVAEEPPQTPPPDPAARKRKRRITLAPPPKPAPMPTGMPSTGESPRITTQDALAAVPEVEGDSSIDSFVGVEYEARELDFRAQERSDPADAAVVAASLVVTPVAKPTPMPRADREGQLDQRSPGKVLFELALDEETGLLVLRRDQVVKEIYLENGDPEYVASNLPQELFGQYLRQKGEISDGELSMALAMLPHFEGKLGAALVALKLLRPMEVLRHLTHQVRQKLLDVFGWERGTYAFYRDKVFEQEAAPLGLDAFEMISAGVQAMPVALLEQRLRPLMDRRLQAVDPPAVPPEVFRMGGQVREVYDRLDGKHALDEELARFDDEQQRELFGRVVYLLKETGLVAS
jgi:serine/threonine-protein kinase